MEPVTVLMPFRNAAATVRASAESVLREPCVHLVAIDDRSEDESVRALLELPRDRVTILGAHGAGIVAALRQGMAATTTEFIARMDADDISLGPRIERGRGLLMRHPRLGVVSCRVRGVPERHIGEGLRRYIGWQNSLVTEDEHRAARFIEAPVCHPTVVLRRKAVLSVGGYQDSAWAEDYDLWLRLFEGGWQFRKIPETLFEWRHGEGRLTFTDPRYSRSAFEAARARYLGSELSRGFAIWGAGRTGKSLARALESYGYRPSAFYDIDPQKIGRTARDVEIQTIEALRVGGPLLLVAVGARGARAEVEQFLENRGFRPERDYLCAA